MSNNSVRSPLLRFLVAALAGGMVVAGWSEEATPNNAAAPSTELETMTVVGTRTERSINEVPATVSVTTSEDMERELVRDIADLVRFEPGVSVGGTGSRHGLSGFNIRGIGDNRVLTVVDGVRVPDEFTFGPFLSARRDLVDVDSLARVEIARGPVSSLYGSDALGGVVSLTTKGPGDYLRGKPWHAEFKAGYSSSDANFLGTTVMAVGNDATSAMLVYTRRSGEETATSGAIDGVGHTRESADPQQIDIDNLALKASWRPAANHHFKLTGERFANDTDTVILSDYDMVLFGATIDHRDAEDERVRSRLSLAYRYDGEMIFADRIDTTVYRQSGDADLLTNEAHTTPARQPQTRFRLSLFEQDITGAYVQFGKAFDVGNTSHYLTYGADYYETDIAELRDGGTFDATGTPVRERFPFPTRDFPLSTVTQYAVFLQDEMHYVDERLLISPSMRYDQFDATAMVDAVYLGGNPGTPPPEDYDHSEVTGKIGVVWRFTDAFSAFARYSQGFRAPPYDDVNVGFTNMVVGFKTISNPDLESERSKGFEFGLKGQADYLNWSASVFHNEYENFIESLALAPAFAARGGIDPSDGLRTFQSINRTQVEIRGAEFSIQANLGVVSESMTDFTLRAAGAFADGDDLDTGEPLNSVEPMHGVVGLAYIAPSQRWGGELVWTLASGKDVGDIDANDPRIEIGGYGTVDVLANADFGDSVQVNVGLFNLGDKRYIRWADTAFIGDEAPHRFTQPGLNLSASVRVEF